MKPFCIFMVGVPGSGKSTLTQHFVEIGGENTVVVSTDNYIEEVAKSKGLTYSDVWQSTIQEAVVYQERVFEHAIAMKMNIIIDQTNMDVKSRKKKLDKLTDDYKTRAIIVKDPGDEVLKERLSNRPGKYIPDHVIQSMRQRYEQPTRDEGFDGVYLYSGPDDWAII